MASSKTGGGASLLGGRVARKALTSGYVTIARKGTELTWRLGARSKPPKNAGDEDATLGEVLLWSALSGAAVAVAKALAVRRMSPVVRRRRGPAPDAEPTGERPFDAS